MPLPVGERAYRAIKQRLLDGRPFPGERLDIVVLSQAVLVSTTPVREALHRLAAERLAENRAGEGFYVARPSVGGLRRLYRWHGRLAAEAAAGGAGVALAETAGDYVARAAALVEAIAGDGCDGEVRHALINADERLRAFRRNEPHVVADAAPALEAAAAALAAGERAALRREIARWSRRLAAGAADILDAVGQPGSDIRDIGG